MKPRTAPTQRQRDILAGRGRRITIPYDEPELLLLVRLATRLTPMHVRFVRLLAECFIAEQMLEEAERENGEGASTH